MLIDFGNFFRRTKGKPSASSDLLVGSEEDPAGGSRGFLMVVPGTARLFVPSSIMSSQDPINSIKSIKKMRYKSPGIFSERISLDPSEQINERERTELRVMNFLLTTREPIIERENHLQRPARGKVWRKTAQNYLR